MMSEQRRIPLSQVLLFFLAVLAVVAAQKEAAASSFGRYHALVIGNQNYKYLSKLNTPRNDAREVAQILRDKYGFKVELLLDATREEILRALEELRRDMEERDNLLIYYAGHGTLDEVTDAGYWQPIDADKHSKVKWIPFTDLITSIKAIQAKHILVIADSCFSGALITTRDSESDLDYGSSRWLRRMRENKSRTALTSGGKKDRVYDEGGGNHSIFAKSLIDVLRNNRTILDGNGLFDRVKVKPLLVDNIESQTPEYKIIPRTDHEDGDFIFVPKGFSELPQKPKSSPTPTPEWRSDSESILVLDEDQPKQPPAAASIPPVREKSRTLTSKDQAQALYEWRQDIRFSKSSLVVEKFLEKFPVGSHVPAAQKKLQELRAQGK